MSGSKSKWIKLMSKIPEIVLVLTWQCRGRMAVQHCEETNTESHSCIKLDGSLSDILAMKSHYSESKISCHEMGT